MPPAHGGVIRRVTPKSLAARVGFCPGDHILAVDGHPLRDEIDFRFYSAEDNFHLTLQREGKDAILDVQRRPGEDLGVEFESILFDRVRTCNNDCFFCFLKGLPLGLRPSLYVKDDDIRLSFSQGNFVTLSNLTGADWQRLEEQRLSPLNVSVHATERDLRRRMLGNPRVPDIVEQLRRLGDLGIRVNTQIVVCPGLNDGEHLARTVDDLAGLYPAVQSIGVVPVAASRHAWSRIDEEAHEWLAPYTRRYAGEVIAQVRPWQRDFRRRFDIDLIYLADEFYLAAGVPLPASSRYDGYPQYQNGIGMTRSLIEDFRRLRRKLEKRGARGLADGHITLVCGTLIAPVLARLASELSALAKLDVRVIPVENRLFGPRVTVSGLLAGADIIDALRGRDSGNLIVMPRHALDHEGNVFLDDVTPSAIEEALNTPIAFASSLSEVLRLSV